MLGINFATSHYIETTNRESSLRDVVNNFTGAPNVIGSTFFVDRLQPNSVKCSARKHHKVYSGCSS